MRHYKRTVGICLALLIAVGCAQDPVHRVYQYRASYVLAEDAIIYAHKNGKLSDDGLVRTEPFIRAARTMLDSIEKDARAGSTITVTAWNALRDAINQLVTRADQVKKGEIQ